MVLNPQVAPISECLDGYFYNALSVPKAIVGMEYGSMHMNVYNDEATLGSLSSRASSSCGTSQFSAESKTPKEYGVLLTLQMSRIR